MTTPAALARAASALAAGDLAVAEAACRAALDQRPDHPPALNLLATVLHRRGRAGDAEIAARRAIERAQRFADPWNTLGLIHRAAGRAGDAIGSFQAAVRLDRSFAEAWLNLADTLDQAGRHEEMLAALRVAIASLPADDRLRARLGRALALAGALQESEALLRAAAATAPDDIAIRIDLATTMALLGRYDEAVASLRACLDAPVHRVNALINLAVLHRDLGRHGEALVWIDRAVGAAPRDPIAHFARGVILMRLGRLAEGWEELEWRWRRPDPSSPWRPSDRPAWDGSPLAGRCLLVWGEQGIGDQILHAAMLEDLRAWTDALRIEVDPRLVPLFARSFPWADVGPRGGGDAGIDLHLPAGSLGRFLRPSLAAFGAGGAYLRADPRAVAAARRRAAGEGRLIGVSWRSTASRFKNAPLAGWGPILATRGCRFVSLQYGSVAADVAAAETATGVRVAVDPAVDALADLDGFAAQVAAMDLVITTSNSTAHVAGALGVPCWVMIPRGRGSLWYWFDGTDRSPWYGSLRLFHQAEMFDWSATIRRVAEALAQLPAAGVVA